jgi:hypothetical protein
MITSDMTLAFAGTGGFGASMFGTFMDDRTPSW